MLVFDYLAGAAIVAAFVAWAGFQLAPADAGGVVPSARAWSWAGGAAAAVMVDAGLLQDLVGLHGGPVDAGRAGVVALGVGCCAFVALVAHTLWRGAGRGRRWRAVAVAFTSALGVLAVVVHMVT
ncbi:hypothetical protein [Streptomyces mirabilis]|uniref:hypothetical protein n=1 Tax=Streptomyces mirabilis TaxID=68239 RepID=UPI0022596913|nr:hypothetical protein [Streptomyces mirabilis]MCX4429598.1 hypothetical protein [Streptomyces mirabilis]